MWRLVIFLRLLLVVILLSSNVFYLPENQVFIDSGTHMYSKQIIWEGRRFISQQVPQRDQKLAEIPWSYEGGTGPQFWGNLHPDFEVCKNGHEQSPASTSLDFSGWKSNVSVIFWNNGRTVGADIATDWNQSDFKDYSHFSHDNQTYLLRQFHFHSPSEHHLEGSYFPLEVHFVHENPETSKFLVIGAFFDYDEKPNPWLESFWNLLPRKPSSSFGAPPTEHRLPQMQLDFSQFVENLQTYHFHMYKGSLTTPPCAEGIKWLVIFHPLTISLSQLRHWYSISSWNARATQRNEMALITSKYKLFKKGVNLVSPNPIQISNRLKEDIQAI